MTITAEAALLCPYNVDLLRSSRFLTPEFLWDYIKFRVRCVELELKTNTACNLLHGHKRPLNVTRRAFKTLRWCLKLLQEKPTQSVSAGSLLTVFSVWQPALPHVPPPNAAPNPHLPGRMPSGEWLIVTDASQKETAKTNKQKKNLKEEEL